MNSRTRTIGAIIGIIAVIVIGSVGTFIAIYLLPNFFDIIDDIIIPDPPNLYEYPGFGEQKMPLDQTIKVGILDDMSWSGEGCYQAAWIAARDINVAGGITIGGVKYYVGLVEEDTKENFGTQDEANAAAYRMIDHAPHFCLGGFKKERFSSYQDIMMTAKIPFIITGTASEEFCRERITANPDFYKYTFRVTPTNYRIQGEVMGKYIANRLITNISTHIGASVNNITLVYEQLDWTQLVSLYVQQEILAVHPGISFTLKPIPAGATSDTYDFATLMDTVNDTKCPLILQVIESTNIGGAMGKVYGIIKPHALLMGINILAQFSIYLDFTGYNSITPFGLSTGGLYEITSHAYAELNTSSLTHDFLAAYRTVWSIDPIYTSIGGYNGLRMGVAAIASTGFSPDNIVTGLEAYDIDSSYPGVISDVAFDQYHDCMDHNGSAETEGLAETLWRQWQPVNNNATAFSFDFNYSCPVVPGVYYGAGIAPNRLMDSWVPTATATLPERAYKNRILFPHWWIGALSIV
ncbi:MAG: hypothetical protein ACFFBP_01895 [Promethearchaeota archaeon]